MPEPTEPSQEQPILSFEEFVASNPRTGYPRYNNFFGYFDSQMAVFYKDEPHYVRFEKENPELTEKIKQGVANRDRSVDSNVALQPIIPDLYEAYKIMRSYGVSDDMLFS